VPSFSSEPADGLSPREKRKEVPQLVIRSSDGSAVEKTRKGRRKRGKERKKRTFLSLRSSRKRGEKKGKRKKGGKRRSRFFSNEQGSDEEKKENKELKTPTSSFLMRRQ